MTKHKSLVLLFAVALVLAAFSINVQVGQASGPSLTTAGTGDKNELTVVGAATGWQACNTNDDTTSYVKSSTSDTNDYQDLFTLTGQSQVPSNCIVWQVRVHIFCQSESAIYAATGYCLLKLSGGSTQVGSANTLGYGFTEYTYDYTGFGVAALGSLQVGVQIHSGFHSDTYFPGDCTYAYAEVFYISYSNIGYNSTAVGSVCLFSSLWNFPTLNNASTFIFSTNNTGTWVNDTSVGFTSWYNSTAAWANVTKTLSSAAIITGFQWFVSDTGNHWAWSSIYSLTLTPNTVMLTTAGTGDSNDLLVTGAATGWQAANTNDADTSYVSSSDADNSVYDDLFTLTNQSQVPSNCTVYYIRVHVFCRSESASYKSSVYPLVKFSGGSTQAGSVGSPSTSYTEFYTDFAPSGSLNLTNLQVGVRIKSGYHSPIYYPGHCTYVYAEVFYISYSDVSYNSTAVGSVCLFSVLLNFPTLNNASGFIFSTNNTGSWVNDTWTSSFSSWYNSTAPWANVVKTLTSTGSALVQFQWFANNTGNYWFSTAVYSLTTAVVPTNDGCEVLNLDESKLLAKMRYYEWSVNCSDANGISYLASVDLNLSDTSNTYWVDVRWNQTGNTTSIVNGSSYIGMSGSYEVTVGDQAQIHFFIEFFWNYPVTTVNVKVTSIDTGSNSVTTPFTLNYPLVKTVQSTTPTPASARTDAGGSDTVRGTVQYAGTSLAVPDSEISSVSVHDVSHNVKGTNSSSYTSYAVPFTLLSTVTSNTYHVSLQGTDPEFPNGDVSGATFSVISDQIRLDSLAVVNSRVNVNTAGTYYATASLQYDSHVLGSGDSFTLSGYVFTWNSGNSKFESSVTESSVMSVTINTFTSGSEATYGITVGIINGKSATEIWDSVTAYVSDPAKQRINVGANASGIMVWGKYDFDSTAFDGTLTLNNTLYVYSTAQRQDYQVSSISGGAYGIAAISSSNSTYCVWDNLTVTDIQSPIYLGSGSYSYTAKLEYGYGLAAISGGGIGLALPNGSAVASALSNSSGWATFTVSQSYGNGTFTLYGINETSYGITVSGANQTFTLYNWTMSIRDSVGNAFSGTTQTVTQSGVSVWSGTDVALNVPTDTFNLAVTWLQGITVNTTIGFAVTTDAILNVYCTTVPFVVSGTTWWVGSNATMTASYASELLTVILSSSPSSFVVVSSCTAHPTYILGLAYDYTSDFSSSYLAVSVFGNETFYISYANWGDLYIQMSDHILGSVSMPSGVLTITASGTLGDIGSLQVHCGTRGNPASTKGVTTSVYNPSSTLLSCLYSFSGSSASLEYSWTATSSGGSSSGTGGTVSGLSLGLLLSLPHSASPSQTLNGSLEITWSGYVSIYLLSVTCDNSDWLFFISGLPLSLEGFIQGNSSVPLKLTVPSSVAPGRYVLAFTTEFSTPDGASKIIHDTFTLDVASLPSVPDVLTFSFLLLLVGAFVPVGLVARKRRRATRGY
jgi:hypothetical protein